MVFYLSSNALQFCALHVQHSFAMKVLALRKPNSAFGHSNTMVTIELAIILFFTQGPIIAVKCGD